ncbi:MAG TPA: (d)CMP kinase [Tissierellaceae bacterium]|nr:(d)CMP kinase [Tissierellaceae bacterium]
MTHNSYYSIAIDGPAGSGKSTIAKQVSKKLNIEYIDTGAMYRAFTLKLLNNNIDPFNTNMILKEIKNTNIDFVNNNIYLDGRIVNDDIRESYISQNVSLIAKIKEVREMMLNLQKNMSKNKNVIMDGRDIGSVVLPDSKFKFFITATPEERAYRRYKELKHRNNIDIVFKDILLDIKKRDYIDQNREIAPLKQSKDSYVIDTTDKTIEETVNYIVSVVLGGK